MLLSHHISFTKTSFIPASCLSSRKTHPRHSNVFEFSFTNIAHIGACLLLFFIDPAFCSNEGPGNEKRTVRLVPSDSSSAAAITLGVTIPCAFIVGILWCYCMSKICKTDQASLARPKLSKAHTASRELNSLPSTSKPTSYMVEDLPRHYSQEVSTHDHFDIESQIQDDDNSFQDIPIHRYHSDSLEEVSGIPIEAGVHMDSFDLEEDVRPPPRPLNRYDSDTSEDLPSVHRPKCKSLDDICNKKHRRKPPASSSEPSWPKKRTAPKYHYDMDSFSSDPQDSDMDDSDVLPERDKKDIRSDL